MELAQHVTDGARRLLVLGGGRQPQLAHGVDDAPLHRLQAVADVRQRPVEDHVHGVIQVRLLGEVLERQPLGAFQIQIETAHGVLFMERKDLGQD
jgi:hypothetical protein